jgi:hypothetical protein
MADLEAYAKPLAAEVYNGEVVLRTASGPFAVSLTPLAAAQTARNLAEAARIAMGNQASQPIDGRD